MGRQPTVQSTLEKMSYQELMHLKREVDTLIDSRQEEAKAELRAKMEAAAQEAGLSLRDVFGGRRTPRPASVKYRDPKNPENTWTGRGRKPRWLTEQLDKRGVKIDDFAIAS